MSRAAVVLPTVGSRQHVTYWVSRDIGWTEAGTNLRGGTMTMKFCRVDGNKFKPINSDPYNHTKSYAVLKLGASCPPNSTSSAVYMDTDDDGTSTNSMSGPYSPNSINGYGATLNWCVFYYASSGTMSTSSFPTYKDSNGTAVQYGVLHDWDVAQGSWVISKKFYFFDDEDCSPTSKYLNSLPAGSIFDPHAELKQMIHKWQLGSFGCLSSPTDYGYFFEFARVR